MGFQVSDVATQKRKKKSADLFIQNKTSQFLFILIYQWGKKYMLAYYKTQKQKNNNNNEKNKKKCLFLEIKMINFFLKDD